MTYDEWEQGVHQSVKDEPAWGLFGYRKSLFLYDLVWKDCNKFDADRRGKSITTQIIRSAGSISAKRNHQSYRHRTRPPKKKKTMNPIQPKFKIPPV